MLPVAGIKPDNRGDPTYVQFTKQPRLRKIIYPKCATSVNPDQTVHTHKSMDHCMHGVSLNLYALNTFIVRIHITYQTVRMCCLNGLIHTDRWSLQCSLIVDLSN